MIDFQKIADRFPHTTIQQDDPYMHRYFVYPQPPQNEEEKAKYAEEEKRKKFAVFLHNIVSSDQDDALHDHPWEWAYSLILSGGYIEERIIERYASGFESTHKRYRPGMINRLYGNTFHRLTLLEDGPPVWTLFVHGPRIKPWGFLDRYGVYTPYEGPTTAERAK